MESKLVVAFVAGGFVGSCFASVWYGRRNPAKQLVQVLGPARAHLAGRPPEHGFMNSLVRSTPGATVDDEVIAEHFTRNRQFFGQRRVADAFVVVIGLGGVGSHCAHMLLRSGVSRMRLVDFDQVSLSSLNRHAVATREDVGTSKSSCLVSHFKKIYPEAVLEDRNMMYEKAVENELLGDDPDFVVDCIDNIDTKVELLAACVRRGIPVLACGGAGAKCDPTRIRVVDVAESIADPLARAVRHRLKRDHGIESGINVLISTEKQRCELVPVEASEGTSMKDYQVLPNFRIRTIPVFGALPAIFGMACAAHVVTQLAGQPFDSEPVFRMQKQQYETQLERLRDRENARGYDDGCIGVDLEDVVYLVKDLWHAQSARAQQPVMSKGMWRSTSDEADEHDELMAAEGIAGLVQLKEREPEFVSLVEKKFARVRAEFGF